MLRAKQQRPCHSSAERNVSRKLRGGALLEHRPAPGPRARSTVVKWAAKQDDKPGRSEAIRRLVELGLKNDK
jgi:hypothetical protein